MGDRVSKISRDKNYLPLEWPCFCHSTWDILEYYVDSFSSIVSVQVCRFYTDMRWDVSLYTDITSLTKCEWPPRSYRLVRPTSDFIERYIFFFSPVFSHHIGSPVIWLMIFLLHVALSVTSLALTQSSTFHVSLAQVFPSCFRSPSSFSLVNIRSQHFPQYMFFISPQHMPAPVQSSLSDLFGSLLHTRCCSDVFVPDVSAPDFITCFYITVSKNLLCAFCHLFYYNFTALSVLTLAAPAAQLAVLSSAILMFSSKGAPDHCPIIDVINALYPEALPYSFSRHHSENVSLNRITLLVSASMSKEGHFPFDNLCQVFVCSFCRFLHPTYPQHSLIAPRFSCF